MGHNSHKVPIVFDRPNYTFNDLYFNQSEIESVTSDDGRIYKVPGTEGYASITTILGATKPQSEIDSLERWRKRVGDVEANNILKDAGDRGTLLHNMCESFIKNEFDNNFDITSNSYALFKQVYPSLSKDIDNIHGIECCLYSHKLKTAGRTDLVAFYKGKLSIIDFKTTRKRKEAHWITNYYIQEAGYAIMFYEMFGLKVEQLVTIMACDNDFYGNADIFIADPNEYYESFVKRVIDYRKLV